jgi:menaquinone-dependent protoporphyrinogen IX oxidase
MPDALIVYYSYTHQTEKAATAIADGLTGIGWRPRLAPLEFADGPLEFPLRPLAKRANALSNASLRGDLVPITFDETIVDQRWDLVLIGSPTWNHCPALPVASFLATPAAHHVLAGTPFAAFVVCRGFWRVNRRRVRRLGGQAGGRWLGGAGFTFDGHFGRTMHSFLHSQVTGGVPHQRFLGMLPGPAGLSAETLNRARDFGLTMARAAAPADDKELSA